MNVVETFYNWLVAEHYSDSTIGEHVATIKRFEAWVTASGYSSSSHLTYTELLHYVQEEKKRGVQTQSINLRLNSLRLFYSHLKEEGIRTDNPAKRIRIKGAVKTVVQDVLDYKELENLYHYYAAYIEKQPVSKPIQLHRRQRNLTLLGLLLWQGLTTGEIAKLQTGDLNLSKGTLYIASTKRSNSRELKLAPIQIIPLHTYVNQTRQGLASKGQVLFSGVVVQVIDKLVIELSGLNPVVRNAHHIRASVLMYWLKLYGKRQVQYMAGHKHISSIERYEKQDIEKLTDQLNKHHPFG